jgi:hypothetical protein
MAKFADRRSGRRGACVANLLGIVAGCLGAGLLLGWKVGTLDGL